MAWIVRLVSLGPATRAPRPPPRSAVVVASGPGAALAEGAAAPGGATVQSVGPRARAQASRVAAKLVDASRPRTPAPLEQPGARWRRAGEDDAGDAMAADYGLAIANPFLMGLDAVNAAARTVSGFTRAVVGVVNGGARVVGAVNVPARS